MWRSPAESPGAALLQTPGALRWQRERLTELVQEDVEREQNDDKTDRREDDLLQTLRVLILLLLCLLYAAYMIINFISPRRQQCKHTNSTKKKYNTQH